MRVMKQHCNMPLRARSNRALNQNARKLRLQVPMLRAPMAG